MNHSYRTSQASLDAASFASAEEKKLKSSLGLSLILLAQLYEEVLA